MAYIRCSGNIGGSLKVRTASGNPCTFTTDLADALVSLTADIVAKQDLHGYDHPWAGGAGKNLCSSIYVNTATAIYQDCLWVECELKPNTTYTLSFNGTNGNRIYTNGDIFTEAIYKDISGRTFVTITTKPVLDKTDVHQYTSGRGWRFLKNAKNQDNDNSFSDVQLELGSQATAYEPYENICPLVGHSELNLTRCGVNIWDEQTEKGNIDTTTGEDTPNNYVLRSVNYIKVSPNTTLYTPVSWVQCYFYDTNKAYISYQAFSTNTINVPNNAEYMRFRLSSDYGTTYNNDISINNPATDTDYHAYNGQTFTVAFGQTVYGGVYDKSGRLTITHGYVDLGTCTWGGGSDVGGKKLFTVAISDIKRPGTTSTLPNWKIEGYELKSQVDAVNYNNVFSGLGWFDGLAFWTNDYTAAQREQLKSDMTGVHVAYELATPIVIDVPSISPYAENGANNIVSDGGGDVNVSYLELIRGT